MSAVRSAPALRSLYERYRTATSLKTSARRPGEWLTISPDSEDARAFEAALGVSPASETAEEVVRKLSALNGALGVFHERDVRMVVQRVAARSRSLELRFVLVVRGKTTRGSKPTPREELPAVREQLQMSGVDVRRPLGSEKVDVHAKSAESSGATASGVGGDEADGTDLCLPDGTPLPDLSAMLMPHEISELWADGKLADRDTLDVLFQDYKHLMSEVLAEDDDVDLTSMVDRFRARATLASGTPSIDLSDDAKGASWSEVSQSVVGWVRSTVQTLRDAQETGHMLVLAPSPGTGKSRGMMQAADQEQGARRRVGYAVLSRAQIPEAEERLKAAGPGVRLIVVEGRHEGNCRYMDQVTVATNAGFSPGSTVCPSCDMYPTFGGGRPVCGYYEARKLASRDRFLASLRMHAAAIILTTHASAVQGSHISKRRYQSFWEFDTLFIDEDPTSSMVQQHEIPGESLTYSKRDGRGNWDGPTIGTMVLREAIAQAIAQRQETASRGFVNAAGQADRVHTRDHGSSFAGGDLHALLEGVSRRFGYTLKGLAATVVDGMSGAPEKGEIMSLNADEVATRFPNRNLAPLFAALDVEITTIAEARAAGVDLEPAYRVHLDLVSSENGLRGVFRVHELRGYGNPRTNIVIGDAYANVEHYEGLFGRSRRDGKVRVIRNRAVWPTTSSLIRVVTHASSKHVLVHSQLVEHLETNVRPVLELERGRQIVFYVHKDMKDDLREWLEERREELGLGTYAIEHWGSGRGKDTYRDFHTFIAVTEYVPNMGALIHEANTVAALAAPGNTRVGHWNGYAPRKGSMTFANSLSSASPFFQAAFHRKATDELAQAVHRIRPAMSAPDGQQKRAYVFGHLVPWSDELIAATTATAVVDSGNDEVDLETEALGRGARFSITETLGLVSEREVAGAIAEVYRTFGCWSHAFAHALLGVPTWATVEKLVVGGSFEGRPPGLLYREDLEHDRPATPVALRVERPPLSWASIARRVQRTSGIYVSGLRLFLAELSNPLPRRYRASWMPSGSNGYEFYGDRERFENTLNAFYDPNADKLRF